MLTDHLHSQRMDLKSRPKRPRLRPCTEALERRELLSADASLLGQFTMASTTPSEPAAITMHVSRSEFIFHNNRVLLSLAIEAPAGSSGPVTMTMTPQKGSSEKILAENNQPSGGARDVFVVSVTPGNYVVQAEMPDATGPLQLNMSLVGDVNGDHKVTAQDIRLIRRLKGVKVGQPGYSLAADPTAAGTINSEDVSLARLNLGAAMKVEPLMLTAGLDPSSNPDGNGVVTSANVTISGQTQPGATVRLDQGDTGTFTQTTTADAQGNYHFAVSVGTGVTPFQVEADAGGQQATADTSVTRGDVIIAWNQTMLDAIRATKDTLGLSTRTMAMVQAAMYDAVNGIDHFGSVYQVAVPAAEAQGASPEAAASEAAYDVLSSLIFQEQPLYDATLAESLADIPDGASKTAGLAVGDTVGAGILAWRANDGSSLQVPYVPGTAPGQWRPTPPDYTVAWGPSWGQVTPFAIPSAKQFLPPPPPALNSPAYAAAVKLTESLGAKNSKTRTPQETQIADFWAYDVAGMGPPPVLYNQIAQDVALEQHNTLDQDARLFSLVDVAMADAGIVTWDAKYKYNLWRPITAIRDANQDGNPATVADPTWTPLGSPGDGVRANFTPNFPAYLSGHAAFGAALFTTLADFYGTDRMTFTIGSDEEPGTYETFNSFSAAAEQNGMSRIYLGIHYIFDKTAGITEGDAVGNYDYQHVMTLKD
ncbi:MAG: phosphatase PAP2 family protein [Isosphaeraceae bacterium]